MGLKHLQHKVAFECELELELYMHFLSECTVIGFKCSCAQVTEAAIITSLCSILGVCV